MSKWYRKEINYSPKRKSKGPNKFNPSSPKPKERQKYETHKLLTIFNMNPKRKNFGRPVKKKSRQGIGLGAFKLNKCGHRRNPRPKNRHKQR